MKSEENVRYRTATVMGTNLHYRETLLTTIRGSLAKLLIDAHKQGEELIWYYDVENHKIDLYRSELLGTLELC